MSDEPTTAEADLDSAFEAGEPLGEPAPPRGGAIVGLVSARLAARLVSHCDATGTGWIFGSRALYARFEVEKDGWSPTLSFIRATRLREEDVPEGDLLIPPDLAVVVVEPRERCNDVNGKVEAYLAEGVRLVWVIDPRSRLADVHRLDGTLMRIRHTQELDGEDVLPGFRCPLSACLPPRKRQANGEDEP